MFEPPEMVQIERQEREARLALRAAQEQARQNPDATTEEHHQLIHRLEAEWKHASERLHQARQASQD